ncbi:hypothetical protein [Kriegella aquimaris]|uniref:Lipoprotein n=1 Tax=Kriegella aquimaris TaxID=192904 RepID=A0A1G9WD51_9FLAO|nr:hypothetical protein [Kriegella aquimaris]SDM82494.1 hypothetical protein SAMN04488514_11562 [Kriegella aquimaris]
MRLKFIKLVIAVVLLNVIFVSCEKVEEAVIYDELELLLPKAHDEDADTEMEPNI